MTDLPHGTTLLVGALLAALSGCASNLSGLGGVPGYACKAPIGSQCTSVSGVYANSLDAEITAFAPPAPANEASTTSGAINTPGFDTPATPGTASASSSATPTPDSSTGAATLDVALQPGSSPAALRSPPRVLRVWIAPWEDADGDLHEASVVHVLVDAGRWLSERVVPRNRTRFDAVRPPGTAHAPAADAAESEVGPQGLTESDRFPPYPQEFRGEDMTGSAGR